jgi:hypothetical protein
MSFSSCHCLGFSQVNDNRVCSLFGAFTWQWQPQGITFIYILQFKLDFHVPHGGVGYRSRLLSQVRHKTLIERSWVRPSVGQYLVASTTMVVLLVFLLDYMFCHISSQSMYLNELLNRPVHRFWNVNELGDICLLINECHGAHTW